MLGNVSFLACLVTVAPALHLDPVHSVEYERGRTRPLAWWVRYPTLEKATKVAQALGNARLVCVRAGGRQPCG